MIAFLVGATVDPFKLAKLANINTLYKSDLKVVVWAEKKASNSADSKNIFSNQLSLTRSMGQSFQSMTDITLQNIQEFNYFGSQEYVCNIDMAGQAKLASWPATADLFLRVLSQSLHFTLHRSCFNLGSKVIAHNDDI